MLGRLSLPLLSSLGIKKNGSGECEGVLMPGKGKKFIFQVLPIEGGEIFVPLTQGRPSQDNIQASDLMMNWLRATNIR